MKYHSKDNEGSVWTARPLVPSYLYKFVSLKQYKVVIAIIKPLKKKKKKKEAIIKQINFGSNFLEKKKKIGILSATA